MVKKDRSNFENKTDKTKMLPELYRTHLKNQLNPRLLTTIEILVWLIQVHKQVRIERLAAHFPLPINRNCSFLYNHCYYEQVFVLPLRSINC